MRSISLQLAARRLAAALFLAVFATGAHAATAAGKPAPFGNAAPVSEGGAPAPAPAPAPVPSGDHGASPPGPNSASGACGGGLVLETPSPSGDAGDAVMTLSRETQTYIKECQCVSQQCVADALDRYAEALAVVAPRLPRQLRDMPSLVARAARRVRAARTTAEAITALHEAIAVIHKDISLVRAEDPAMQQSETRSGVFVAETLNVASLSLEKAGGL
jgi:hypothetical protein